MLQNKAAETIAEENLSYTDISSPIDGRIGLTAFTEGNLVNPASGVLATIVSEDPIYAEFPVSVRQLDDLAAAHKGKDIAGPFDIKAFLTLANGQPYDQPGDWNYVGNQVDPQTDTLLVRAVFPNPKHQLVDGAYVTVRVEEAEQQPRLVIPRSTLQLDQIGVYVLTVNNERRSRSSASPPARRSTPKSPSSPGCKPAIALSWMASRKCARAKPSRPLWLLPATERPSDLQHLCRSAEAGVRHLDRHHAGRTHRDLANSGRPVSRHRAAAGHADRQLSRRGRRDRGDDGRTTYRGADQRRRQRHLLSIGTAAPTAPTRSTSPSRSARTPTSTRSTCKIARASLSRNCRPTFTRQGLSIRKKSAALLQVLTVYSPKGSYDQLFLSNYATINIIDALSRINGVGQASLFGPLDYSLRVWLDPSETRDIQPDSRRHHERDSGAEHPGRARRDRRRSGVERSAQRIHGADARQARESRGVRRNPAQDQSQRLGRPHQGRRARGTGREFLGPLLPLQRGADGGDRHLSVARRERDPSHQGGPRSHGNAGEAISQRTSAIPSFSTRRCSCSATIEEVLRTLGEAFVLVGIVVFLFLGKLRTTLIPLIAVPVSIIGAFAVMLAIGYTANTVSLSGARAGHRHRGRRRDRGDRERRAGCRGGAGPLGSRGDEEGDGGDHRADHRHHLGAACQCSCRSRSFPASAGNCFVSSRSPFRVSMLISALNALTLSPGAVLGPDQTRTQEPRAACVTCSARSTGARDGYGWVVARLVRVSVIGIVATVAVILASGWLFSRTPQSFLPEEDQGALFAALRLPEGASINRTGEVVQQVEDIIKSRGRR